MSLERKNLGDALDLFNGKKPELTEEGEFVVFGSNGTIGRSAKFNHPSSVILGRVGAYCGAVKFSSEPFWASDNTIVTRPKGDQDLKYWYYKLQTIPLRGYAGGAAQPLITHSIIKPIETEVHQEKLEQELISGVLSAYDDLIENNRRRIDLLEEAARLLYREWFVNLRFPGHEHVKVVDGLPEGWTRPPLGSLAWLNMGQSPKSEFYNDIGEGLPFHQGVTNYGFRFVEDRTFSTNFTKLAEPGDILFSVRAPVGRINLTMNRMVLGRGLASLRSKSDKQSFLFYQLKNHFFKEDLIGGGAIYAATNKKELEALEVTQPTDDLADAFEQIAQPIDAQIKALTLQNRELVRARDILLPRLMDGRLEV